MKNIGIVFVKMGQYADAITTYEHIMSDKPDVETGTIVRTPPPILKRGGGGVNLHYLPLRWGI